MSEYQRGLTEKARAYDAELTAMYEKYYSDRAGEEMQEFLAFDSIGDAAKKASAYASALEYIRKSHGKSLERQAKKEADPDYAFFDAGMDEFLAAASDASKKPQAKTTLFGVLRRAQVKGVASIPLVEGDEAANDSALEDMFGRLSEQLDNKELAKARMMMFLMGEADDSEGEEARALPIELSALVIRKLEERIAALPKE